MPDIFLAPKKDTVHKKPAPAVEEGFKPTGNIEPLDVSFSLQNPVYLFSSFAQNPSDISFKNQEKDEKVLLFLRKHFITNLPWILSGAILIFIPLFSQVIFNLLRIDLSFLPARYILFFALFYYFLVATYIFINFITWFFNISFLTNIRIVDVDFSGIIYKNVAATKISLVQDVSYDQTGVFRTFFDYGDVLVQTAGEETNFDFEAVPRPNDAVHIIGNLIGKHGRV